MAWEPDELTCGTHFDHATPVQHQHPMADVLDHREVAGEDEAGDTLLLLELFEQIEEVSDSGAIDASKRFVHDQEFRLNRHGTGNPYALALSTIELVRVKRGVPRIESHHPEQFLDALLSIRWAGRETVHVKRFGEELLCREQGIERMSGVRENELNLPAHSAQVAGVEVEQFLTLKSDPAGGCGYKTDDGTSERRFPAASFAHDTDSLVFVDVETDAAHGLDESPSAQPTRGDRVMDLQIADLEEFHAKSGEGRGAEDWSTGTAFRKVRV